MHDSETVRTVMCGTARFTIDSLDVVTQYDHTGTVVGIFRAEDTPNLRAWMGSTLPKYHQQGRTQFKKEEEE